MKDHLYTFARYINSCFECSEKYSKEKLFREIAASNKSVFVFHLIVLLVAVIEVLNGTLPFQTGCIVLTSIILILASLTLSWSLGPRFFQISHNIILSIGTVAVAHQSKGGICRSWIGTS